MGLFKIFYRAGPKETRSDQRMKSPFGRTFRALIWLCIAFDSIARNIDPNELFNTEESILGLEMIDSLNPSDADLQALYDSVPTGYKIEVLGTQEIGVGRRHSVHRRDDEYAFLYEDDGGSSKKKDKAAKKAKKKKGDVEAVETTTTSIPTTTTTTSTTTT